MLALASDIEVLQFALTLEHLENAFYKGALEKFDDAAFKAAGLPDFARGRFLQVAEHEASHVELLQTVLGDQAPIPCEYSL
jgi:rubrerythrin